MKKTKKSEKGIVVNSQTTIKLGKSEAAIVFRMKSLDVFIPSGKPDDTLPEHQLLAGLLAAAVSQPAGKAKMIKTALEIVEGLL